MPTGSMVAATRPSAAAAPLWASALAAGVPLVTFLATASGHGYWLDGGEFEAQASDFGIAHPPGHPLAGLLHTAAALLLPVGSIAFRVALLSALCGGAGALFLYRASRTTYRHLGSSARNSDLLAIATTWAAAGSVAYWLQAVRPEVYALQAALLLYALERIVHLEARWPTTDLRPLYAASLALGLALANHHFLALILFPAGAGLLARVVLLGERAAIGRAAGFLSLGLLTYAYLPLRAHAATLALGAPDRASRLWWVVSAEAFQKNQGEGVPEPLGDRFADVLIALVESVHWAGLLLALIGIYLGLRKTDARRVVGLWALVLLIGASARAWLGYVRDNPDALGYLVPALAALVVLAGSALVLVATTVRRPALIPVSAALLMAATVARAPEVADVASMASFRDTDAIDDVHRRELPPGAVLVLFHPHSIFRYWGGEASERLRPDVTMVPVPFLTYPGMVERLTDEAPELQEALRAYLLRGELRQPDLESLANERPLLLELDPRVPRSLYDSLAPEGAYHRVLPGGATDADQREGAERQAERFDELARVLGEVRDPQTRRELLWRHYHHALYLAETGHRDEARAALARARTLAPDETRVVALAAALAEGEGPLDTAPFQMGQMGPSATSP